MAEITSVTNNSTDKVCGIIMPISAIGTYSAEHWRDVLDILKDVVSSCGLKANMVSTAEESGIIQKRIIQNLYHNEIVICDTSGKNPNVMFELGIRLAFDRPTIIIKDSITDYSFDTSVIEHLNYPVDLRFNKINEFKNGLKAMITGTLAKSRNDPNYSTFLKAFGSFTLPKLATEVVDSNTYIIKALTELQNEVQMIRQSVFNGYDPKNPLKRLTPTVSDFIKDSVYAAIAHFMEKNRIAEININDLVLREQLNDYIVDNYATTSMLRHFTNKDTMVDFINKVIEASPYVRVKDN